VEEGSGSARTTYSSTTQHYNHHTHTHTQRSNTDKQGVHVQREDGDDEEEVPERIPQLCPQRFVVRPPVPQEERPARTKTPVSVLINRVVTSRETAVRVVCRDVVLHNSVVLVVQAPEPTDTSSACVNSRNLSFYIHKFGYSSFCATSYHGISHARGSDVSRI